MTNQSVEAVLAAPPPRNDEAEVVVVGGGIMGCAAAYYLAAHGLDTILVERASLARGATGATAGNIHLQLERNVDGPTVWRLEELPAEERRSLQTLAALHSAAANVWEGLEGELKRDLGFRKPGGIMIAETQKELEYLKLKSRLERELGILTEVLSPDEARVVEPGLASDLSGACFCPGEGFASPLLVGRAFGSAILKAGGRIMTWSQVVAIECRPEGGYLVRTQHGVIKTRCLVNATGAAGAKVAEMVGIRIGIRSRLLQVCVTERTQPIMTRLVNHVTRRLTLKQLPAGNVLISGGWHGEDDSRAGGGRGGVVSDSIRGNVWVAQRAIPAIRELSLLRAWVGDTAYSDNDDLLIGEHPHHRGFYSLISLGAGFTLGPLLGRVTAEMIMGRRPSAPVESFLMANR